jgi:hypothetical protein
MNTPVSGNQQTGKNYAAEFMLQEYSRIIDAYHELHLQKNELIKVYLAFASLPISIVAIFLALFKYVSQSAHSNSLLEALQIAATCLSILLVFVSIAVIMSMLKIRGEQYLYVKTINGARMYFKEQQGLPEQYLVLPSNLDEITFGQAEPTGRAFWESSIIGVTGSLLLAFLAGELAHRLNCPPTKTWLTAFVAFVLAVGSQGLFVRRRLKKLLDDLVLRDQTTK